MINFIIDKYEIMWTNLISDGQFNGKFCELSLPVMYFDLTAIGLYNTGSIDFVAK